MAEQTCQGCIHLPDFPKQKCQSCSRACADHYESINQGKIIKLQLSYTHFVIRDGGLFPISGGLIYEAEFVYNNTRLQNLHQLEFQGIEELDEESLLYISLYNPNDGMKLCTYRKFLTSHVAGVYAKRLNLSFYCDSSIEYAERMIEANAKE